MQLLVERKWNHKALVFLNAWDIVARRMIAVHVKCGICLIKKDGKTKKHCSMEVVFWHALKGKKNVSADE